LVGSDSSVVNLILAVVLGVEFTGDAIVVAVELETEGHFEGVVYYFGFLLGRGSGNVGDKEEESEACHEAHTREEGRRHVGT
jgi:hypothetical protein